MRTSGVAALLALCACGLVDPDAPPVRVVSGVPPLPGAPIPAAGRAAAPSTAPFPGWALLWHDEFDGDALDPGKWNVDEGIWRDAVNSRDSVLVGGGVLSLVTFTDYAAGVHRSPHINTQGKLEAVYGYYEARVRFLDSPGEWCSFFLWPRTMGNPLGDPGRAGVEIDIFEHRDANTGGADLRDVVQVGLNWDMANGSWQRSHQVLAHPEGAPLSHAWHTYSALWTDAGVTFYIDEIPVWRSSAAVSHRTQSIFLSCEVRSGSWAGYIPPGGYGPRESSTARMELDWVRVWQQAR